MKEYQVENLIEGMQRAGLDETFIAQFSNLFDAYLDRQYSPYLLAVDLVITASEIILCSEDSQDLLDFGKYLNKVGDITMKCALTKRVVNHDRPGIIARRDDD